MHYRRFGKTDMTISVFTFGAMRIPPVTEEEAVATVLRAVELGINHLETARGYGSSESLLGKAMPHLNRESLYITTKIPPTEDASTMRRWIEESLERMRISYIDNFDIHGLNDQEILDLTLKPGGCLKAVRQAMDEGLIRHLGFSTHAPVEIILKAMKTGEFESVNLHYYYFNQRNHPAIRLAEAMDMGVLIISPTDKGGQLHQPTPLLSRLTAPLTPIEFNHRFNLADPAVTTLTLGAALPHEFDAHLTVADRPGPLDETERGILSRLDEQFKTLGSTYCSFCHDCLPCPEDIHIPEALRLRNLARAFDMVGYSQYRYTMFGSGGHWYPGVTADRCTDCGDCLPRCPLNLPIPELLSDTHRLLSGEAGKRLWTEE
ncbi:MAG: aldo/keto reductase [Armatimonadetes bacterium]|nr:aldo/keto reductase [Armatimonadota bacterium]